MTNPIPLPDPPCGATLPDGGDCPTATAAIITAEHPATATPHSCGAAATTSARRSAPSPAPAPTPSSPPPRSRSPRRHRSRTHRLASPSHRFASSADSRPPEHRRGPGATTPGSLLRERFALLARSREPNRSRTSASASSSDTSTASAPAACRSAAVLLPEAMPKSIGRADDPRNELGPAVPAELNQLIDTQSTYCPHVDKRSSRSDGPRQPRGGGVASIRSTMAANPP
jgi:hypothetical protein